MTDLSDLLEPISSASPCGENLEYDSARMALDVSIQGTPENQFSGEKAQPPSWRDVQKESLALLRKSKDLQVMLYLIRALVQLEGFQGFKDGLELLEKSLESYWDELHPQLDPSDGLDPTLRVNILEELVSQELIINPLSLAMLVESRSVGRFCLRDIHYATEKLSTPDGVNKPDISTIKAAFLDVEQSELTSNFQVVNDCLGMVSRIESLVTDKVGSSNAPNLDILKALLKEVRHHFEQYAGSRLTEDSEAGDQSSGEDSVDGAPPVVTVAKGFVPGVITTRRDVINALDSIGKYYREYEPSSPVPILLNRAKYLVTADFMEVVKNMMPDAIGQLEVLKGPDPNDTSGGY